MGLYLCMFVDEEDEGGVDVGGYDDFGRFREEIAVALEGGKHGSEYPALQLHSDCDGEWSMQQLKTLESELIDIQERLSVMPPKELVGWQASAAARVGLKPKSLLESYVDVNGQPLAASLLRLVRSAISRGVPVSFQ